MLISDSHQFVFVHIRKAAGTSLRQILEQVALPKNNHWWFKLLSRNGFIIDYHRFSFRKHDPLMLAEKSMPENLFKQYFKFAFVRNPWDRLVSEYEYIKTQRNHSRYKKLMAMSFEQYIEYQAQRVAASQLNALIKKDGELGIDYIGRFEHLHDSLADISGQIKLDCTRIPHINKLNKAPYQSYYTKESAERVALLWSKDIETFGYKF